MYSIFGLTGSVSIANCHCQFTRISNAMVLISDKEDRKCFKAQQSDFFQLELQLPVNSWIL